MNLEGNVLEEIPEAIFFLEPLMELDLSDNAIRVVPDEIASLENLKWLDLRNNRLTSLPLSIRHLSSTLEMLLLEGNLIEDEMKTQLQHWLPDTRISFSNELF